VEQGKAVYESYCVICHGEKGDGKGLMGIIHRAQQRGFVVQIYPRDFTAGVFKFRSTPSGELPTDADLMRTVRNGIARSGMPSHKDLSEAEIHAVVQYIKTFSQRWKEEEPGTPIEIGAVPGYVGSKKSVERGRKVYDAMKCWECHGKTGRGDGPSSARLKDDWGDRILPFDFTSGALKGGTDERDLLRTFITGLDGTPMPSYYETIPEKDQWDLVSYCIHLMKGGDIETAGR
jgi:mono/diheme cytochrome c family protein